MTDSLYVSFSPQVHKWSIKGGNRSYKAWYMSSRDQDFVENGQGEGCCTLNVHVCSVGGLQKEWVFSPRLEVRNAV